VLESDARKLLPSIELEELVVEDDDSSDEGSGDGADSPAEESQAAETSATDDAPSASEEPVEAAAAQAEPASKLGESKVAGAAASTPTAAAAAAPPKEYTQAQLSEDLGLVQMTASMGMVSQMMEVLTRIAFGLGDTDRDGKVSRAEASAFATTHLRDDQQLAKVLGLSGGALSLDDASAVDKVVAAAFGVCDADSDGLVSGAEARAPPCRKHLYELIMNAPQPNAPAAAAAGGANAAAAAGGAGASAAASASGAAAAGGGASAAAGAKPKPAGGGGGGQGWSELLKSMGAQGQGGAAVNKPNPLFAPLERKLRRAKAMVLRNLREPNFNTFLAGLGVAAAVLQQVLTFDVLDARHHLRGLVGGNLPDFTNRLQNVALGLFCVAAFARFE